MSPKENRSAFLTLVGIESRRQDNTICDTAPPARVEYDYRSILARFKRRRLQQYGNKPVGDLLLVLAFTDLFAVKRRPVLAVAAADSYEDSSRFSQVSRAQLEQGTRLAATR